MLLPEPVRALVHMALNAVSLIVVIYALLSWFPNLDRNHPLVKLINSIGDTICAPVRKLVPPRITGSIDLSPLIVILAISFLQRII